MSGGPDLAGWVATIPARGPRFDGSNLTGRLMKALFEREPSHFGTSIMARNSQEPRTPRNLPAVASPPAKPAVLISDVRALILQAREGVARAVDSTLTALYWSVGRRIRQDILKEKRAEYGEKIVQALTAQLEPEFGRGFGKRNLFTMVRFAAAFPDEQIVSALRRQLTWTHFTTLVYIEYPLKRDFYAEMCRIEGWNTRTLVKRIGGMLFERTALSKKRDKLIKQELATLRSHLGSEFDCYWR